MPTLKSPIPYIGGKAHLAPRIIDLLPRRRSCYVEVFGGAGHVMTQKPLERSEIFNDIQSVVVNFFLVVKEHNDELSRRLQSMPYAREEYDRILAWWTSGRPGPVSDIEQAARWVYLLKTSFSSRIGADFGYGRGKNVGLHLGGYASTPARLAALAQRWHNVHIENLDFGNLIPRYDEPQTVFYCDPPYIGHEQDYPLAGFTRADHTRLAEVLSQIQGRAIVSYYAHPDVDGLYPKDSWRRVRVTARKHSAVATRTGPKTKPISHELILMNYGPDGRRLRRAGGKSRR